MSDNKVSPLKPFKEAKVEDGSNHQYNEIDLRVFAKAVWQGKLLILFCTTFFLLCAVIFAFTSQERWTSQVKVWLPYVHDTEALQSLVEGFMPLLENEIDDNKKSVLNHLRDTDVLFNRFIEEFNSNVNKQKFFENSIEFQNFISSSQDTKEDKISPRWFNSISSKDTEKSKVSQKSKESPVIHKMSPVALSFSSMTKESSAIFLREYIEFISEESRKKTLSGLRVLVKAKENGVRQQYQMKYNQMRQQLDSEITRSKYALRIAKAAGITELVEINDENEFFNVKLGTKAIEEKIIILQSLKDYSLMDQSFGELQANLSYLENLKVDSKVQFKLYRSLDDIDQPLGRKDSPERALIVVLGILLGGFLGVVIVVVRFSYRKI